MGNEWVEIQNASDRTVDVSRWLLGDSSEEHRYRLPVDISLAPGELLVIAANEFVVREDYGIDNVVGDFEFNLGNGGDSIQLFDAVGNPIDSVTYSDESPLAQRPPMVSDRRWSCWIRILTTQILPRGPRALNCVGHRASRIEPAVRRRSLSSTNAPTIRPTRV